MAWQDEMIPMLRYMLGDISDTAQTYSDDSLENTLLLAAKQVAVATTFSQEFAASMSSGKLAPDPTLAATRDDSFVNLVTLRSAGILDRTAATLAARRAIIVKDGTSAIDLSQVADATIRLLEKGWNAVYDDELFKYQYRRSQNAAGAAVMTPFRLFCQGYPSMNSIGGSGRSREMFP